MRGRGGGFTPVGEDFNIAGEVQVVERKKAKVEKVPGFTGMSGTTIGVEKMHGSVVARSAQLIAPK